MEDTDLNTIHGDSWQSPWWAILDGDGDTFNVDGWTVRSQLRRSTSSSTVVYEWTLEHGIDVSSADVELESGTSLTTSAVRLVLAPSDYAQLPPSFSGVIDIEISSDNSDDPDERYTVVVPTSFHIRPDVTRG